MICPECRAEYVEGVTICADCQVGLVHESQICVGCGSLNIKAQVCQDCGRVLHEGYRCFDHPERIAKYVCLVCGFQMCSKCDNRRGEKHFCSRHSSADMMGGMVHVYSASSIIEAGFLKHALNEQGIACEILMPEILDLHPDGSSSPIKLFVPKEHLLQVEEMINSLYFCSNCGVVCLPDRATCYNCGQIFE